MIREEPHDPALWPPVSPLENDVHHWLNRNPVSCEGLVQTMWGGADADLPRRAMERNCHTHLPRVPGFRIYRFRINGR